MLSVGSFAETAMLVGDPARASMLAALMDGRALTARELAEAAGITPQTASGHLARLTGAGLLAVERQGRHRYHRVASPDVARMIEGIMAVAAARDAAPAPRRVATGPKSEALRRARTCYDHLAGRIAVAMADHMADSGLIDLSADGGALTSSGENFLRDLGVAIDERPARGRVFCRPCLDWSERRHHIAGSLGAALCRCCLDKGWLRRVEGSRELSVTPGGQRVLREAFGVSPEILSGP
jgi:DNA-binding transcriptional ArsR family regulator